VQGAATAAENETLNNWLNHVRPQPMMLSQAEQYQQAVTDGDTSLQNQLAGVSAQNDQNLSQACAGGNSSSACQIQVQAAQAGGNLVYSDPLGNGQYYTYANPLLGATGPESFPFATSGTITNLDPSVGAATLDSMLGSPLAGILGGFMYAAGSPTGAYYSAQLGNAITGMGMAAGSPFVVETPQSSTSVSLVYGNGSGSVDVAATNSGTSSVWDLSPFARGTAIEQQLGQNLPQNFPVIDIFDNGMATSIKSLNVGANSYQSTSTLSNTITGYINSVAGYNGTGPQGWAGVVIDSSQITGRSLDLVIPNAGSAAQQQAINQAVQYGLSKGVQVNVIIHP
jgi:hypothetical protein